MTIAEWLNGSKDYREGCYLYKKHGNSKVLLSLFESGENSLTKSKLIAELQKLNEVPATTTPVKKPQLHINGEQKVKYKPHPDHHAQLPTELQLVDKLRDISFKEMSNLHSKLLLMPTDEDRLTACKRIHELDLILDECWYKLDYYAKTGTLPAVENDQPIRTIGDVVQLAKNIPTYLSKIKKRLDAGPSPQETEELMEKKVNYELKLNQINSLMNVEIYGKTGMEN